MKLKKEYVSMEMEIVELDEDDVIRTSVQSDPFIEDGYSNPNWDK